MNNIIKVFCLCFTIVSAAAPDSLQLVNVLYRHGDRSPVVSYPNDPHKDVWPQGFGWLTTEGMRQQYALGQFLRSEYGSLLSKTYNNTEIVVQASNVNRCLMSAYCNLAGLYPPQGDQVWNQNLMWQPIPVHTRPEDEDNTLAIEENCPRYNQLYDQELHSPIVQQEEKTNAALYAYVANYTGVKKENISDEWMVSDTLFCEKTHNYTLPAWTQKMWGSMTVYQHLRNISAWGFGLMYNGTQLSRLKGGPLLKSFIKNMQKVASKQQHYKMYMYSAHDSTVAAVTDAMQVYNHMSPPYATAVLVELHIVDNDHCVKIRYRNDSSVPPYTLVHPDCQKECCPLQEFVNVTKSRVPVNWTAECALDSPSSEVPGFTLIFTVICGLLLVLAIMLSIMFYIRGKRNEKYQYWPLKS